LYIRALEAMLTRINVTDNGGGGRRDTMTCSGCSLSGTEMAWHYC